MSRPGSVDASRRASAIAGIICRLLVLLAMTGCAVYKQAAAPPLKDLSVLKSGTTRARVIAELGTPVRSEITDDGRRDVFTFIQGYSRASKSGLATAIALEDIATLGAAELAFAGSGQDRLGKKMTIAVRYNAADEVIASETILVTQP